MLRGSGRIPLLSHAPILQLSDLGVKSRLCFCRVAIKVGKAGANKTGMGLEDGTMEQDEGFGFEIGGVAEVVEVAIGTSAAEDGGTGWGVHGVALGADGDFAVVADADAGLLAPDVGPPGTLGSGTDTHSCHKVAGRRALPAPINSNPLAQRFSGWRARLPWRTIRANVATRRRYSPLCNTQPGYSPSPRGRGPG